MTLGLVPLTLAWLALAVPPAARAASFDVAADFSATNNPNTPWSYGTSATLGGAFTLLPHNGVLFADTTNAPIAEWYAAQSGVGPAVLHNGNATPQTFGQTVALDAGQYEVGPGTPDFVVTRWIAPSAGTYQVSALFEGMSFVVGATTDVHVLLNGNSLFSAAVDGWAGRPYISTPRFGPSPSQSYAASLTLATGDVLDFAVGNGGNGQAFDVVGLSAQIRTAVAVPEPASLTLLGFGAAGLLGYGWRRRWRSARRV
jgi:hypothetical protein